MSIGSDEIQTPDDILNDALVAFTGCIGMAIPDVCSYGLTIGETYVPFDPDNENDPDCDVACEQVWVRVMGVTPRQDPATDGWGGDCGMILEMELEVGVLRCVEVKEDGEAPTESEVLAYAMQAMTDMLALQQAALSCEVWDSIEVGQWQPSGPLGGQYGGTWNFTVGIDPTCAPPATGTGRTCGLWTGNGPPGDIPGALDGDEYIDLLTGSVYTLNV